MNTIPEFVKQGFLQEYRCIYSGFEDDLDKIKGKENKIDFFKQEFSTSRYGCYEANKNLNCFLGLNSKNKGIKIIYKKGVWNYNCGLIRKRTLTSEYEIYYLK